MLLMQKLALVALVGLAPIWEQSGAAPATPGAPPPAQPEYRLEPVATPNAVYPTQARDQKTEGEIVAALLVSDTGDVKNVRVFKGDPLLVKSAEDAVSKWKFKPVVKGDKAIAVITTAKFRFVLSDDGQVTNGVAAELGAAHELPRRVRVSSGVAAGLLLEKVQPVYPSEARQAGIQGAVVLQGVISKGGKVTDLQVVSGPKELVAAAIEAVQQWRYKPYVFMGDPIEVDTQFQVNFTLSR
jgi:TonB family protein